MFLNYCIPLFEISELFLNAEILHKYKCDSKRYVRLFLKNIITLMMHKIHILCEHKFYGYVVLMRYQMVP